MYEYVVKGDLSMTGKNDPAAMAKTVNEMAAAGWRLVSTASVAHQSVSYVYMFFERARP